MFVSNNYDEVETWETERNGNDNVYASVVNSVEKVLLSRGYSEQPHTGADNIYGRYTITGVLLQPHTGADNIYGRYIITGVLLQPQAIKK